jgi:signal transduction histidine kinase
MRGVKSPEQAQRAYETIYREADRLARMLDQLSRVAETRLEQASSRPVRFDLAECVASAVDAARLRWPEHRFGYDSGDVGSIEADPRRIAETLAVLLDNAAMYSQPGSHVEVAVERNNGRAMVRVQDEGVGIPADELDSIFLCFKRGSSVAQAGSSAARGLGAGLYLSRAIAEAVGGRLWAESTVGAGSTFHLELPVAD